MTNKERLQNSLFEFAVLSETIGKLHCAKYMVDGDQLNSIIENLEDAMLRRDAMQKDIFNLIENSMTEEQFEQLSKKLQIWALRDNKVLYVSFGVAPESNLCVRIGVELGKDYPNVLRKDELKNYKNIQVVTLHNYNE